jgi:hypothetical protein
MNIEGILAAAGLLNYEGLTTLFRAGLQAKRTEDKRIITRKIEKRLGLAPLDQTTSGLLKDVYTHLQNLQEGEHFDTTLALIAAAGEASIWHDVAIAEKLANSICDNFLVRFSFDITVLPCLIHARFQKLQPYKPPTDHRTRYAGLGADVPLIAFAALFLDLDIHAESGLPWEPDHIDDDGEPFVTPPDIEMSFPPLEFLASDAIHLEKSVRNSKLPRVVDKEKFDLKSVMLNYLSFTSSSALVFTSEKAVASTKQSHLKARKSLLDSKRIQRVTELKMKAVSGHESRHFLIKLNAGDVEDEEILMTTVNDIDAFTAPSIRQREIPGKGQKIPLEEVRSVVDTLKPTRYISTGPTGGSSLLSAFRNSRSHTKHKLSELFDVIRPKTTRHDPTGENEVREVRPGDISRSGEVLDATRKIWVRETVPISLERQKLQVGDILFAHRGPIGRVAYVTKDDVSARDRWAAQSLVIIRRRARQSTGRKLPFCDPRILFMLLLTPKEQEHWRGIAVGSKSPTVPIGEIERLGLPDRILSKVKKSEASRKNVKEAFYGFEDFVLDKFDEHQQRLSKVRKLQSEMDASLSEIWDVTWSPWPS